MNVTTMFARPEDTEEWMSLAALVADSFPGLDMMEYRKALEESIEKQQAICARKQGRIVGILLFSVEHSLLAFLAVHPAFRKCGVAVAMIEYMTPCFPTGTDIWVTTYREGDPQGAAARALYLRCGFVPDDLVTEMDYPCQRFVLHR